MLDGIMRLLLTEAAASGRRSSALSSLLWLFFAVAAAFLLAVYLPAPEWMQTLLVLTLVIVVVVCLFGFVVLMFKNPDALRSESYNLKKFEIEKRMLGDHRSGLFPADRVDLLSKQTEQSQELLPIDEEPSDESA